MRRLNRRVLGLAAAGLCYLVCFALIRFGSYAHNPISDVPLYDSYATAVRHGATPYRDVAIVYPPGSLAVFLAPLAFGSYYSIAFWWLMAAMGLGALLVASACGMAWWGLGFLALSPLLVGTYLGTRYDLWPTLLLVVGMACLLRDRHRLGWAALGAAFAAKLFPAVMMPIAAVWTVRRAGARELRRSLAVALAVVAAAFGPFVVMAPDGLFESLWHQFSRPLQIETLAASILMTFGHPHPIASDGSLNLVGDGSLATASSVVSWLVIVAIWVVFARGETTPDRFVRLSAAAICAFIVFGRVLSPQYMIWLLPLVPLLRGRRGIAATALLGAALLDTLYWFPGRYWTYVYGAHLAWLVLARNLMLVGLLALLSLPGRALPHSWSRARPGRTRPARLRSAHPPRPSPAGPADR